MIDKNYVLPWTQLWAQNIFEVRPLSLIFFSYGKATKSFTLGCKERNFKTSSINAITKKGNISEVDGTRRLHTLSTQPWPVFAFLFQGPFFSRAQAIKGFEKNDILLL